MGIHPLSIILVKSDSKGDRLLFRYPHMTNHVRDSSQCTKRKNPYSLTNTEDLLQVCSIIHAYNIIRIREKCSLTIFKLCYSRYL